MVVAGVQLVRFRSGVLLLHDGCRPQGKLYLAGMKFAQIEQEALALPERDRAALAAKLLTTLPPVGTDVSDEEIGRREQELESGQVTPISHEEFVRRVEQERGR